LSDSFAFAADSASNPARRLAAITPSDTVDLTEIPKALWVAVGGTVTLVGVGDVANAGTALGTLPAGTLIPVRARRVRATGTSATLVGLF
jgi:hypothetical protein